MDYAAKVGFELLTLLLLPLKRWDYNHACLFCFLLETGSYYIVHTTLDFVILLYQLAEQWR